jgi:hypothetical protein
METACVIGLVILPYMRAWRSAILLNSTNTSPNHLLSSVCTYANHFIQTQSNFMLVHFITSSNSSSPVV